MKTSNSNGLTYSNLRRTGVNQLSVIINGEQFRITSEEGEISLHEEKSSIPSCLRDAESLGDFIAMLDGYNLTVWNTMYA
ncbi:MAG: hypothetical protein WCL08_13670 [Verrucomicrobiota bacterium]